MRQRLIGGMARDHRAHALPRRLTPLAARVAAAATAPSKGTLPDLQLSPPWGDDASTPINMVFKFGGSSVASAERMAEVAQIVCSFPGVCPVVVLSAMGKTTNLLLEAGEEALVTPPGSIASLAPLRYVQ